MTIFLILAPFGSFALLMLVTSAEIALFASAAICLTVIGIDVARGRSVKMLGAGSVAVFSGIGAYVTLIDPNLSHSAVKLAADVGVFAISLASLIIRKPFVLQYALEEVDAEIVFRLGEVHLQGEGVHMPDERFHHGPEPGVVGARHCPQYGRCDVLQCLDDTRRHGLAPCNRLLLVCNRLHTYCNRLQVVKR